MSIGNDLTGTQPAKGLLDEFQTFNYPLSSNYIATNYQYWATLDSDGDRLTDIQESELGTSPYLYDTYSVGVSDGDQDFDGDGLCNWAEFNKYGTDPQNANTVSSLHNDGEAMLLAFTNDPNTVIQLSITNGADTNQVVLTLLGAVAGTNYLIFSKDLSTTNSRWRVEQNLMGTNIAIVQLNGRQLAFIGGYGEDSDQDGLPDAYEILMTHTDPDLPDTGNTGVGDGYKDPDGDGYSNLQEFYNGTDPLVADSSDGPQNVSLNYTSGNSGDVTLQWQRPSGDVINYLIFKLELIDSFYYWIPIATNTSSQLTYQDTSLSAASDSIGVQAVYANSASGINTPSAGVTMVSGYTTPCAIVNGPGGHRYMVISSTLTNLAAIHLTNYAYTAPYPIDHYRYLQPQTNFPNVLTNGVFDISIGRFTNGIAQLTDVEVPPFLFYEFYANAVSPTGKNGDADNGYYYATPFLDATAQLKQNLNFLLRAASYHPLKYELYIGPSDYDSEFLYPTNYVYADYFTYELYYSYVVQINPLAPFEDNYFFRNFILDTAHIDGVGNLTTGFDPSWYYNAAFYSFSPLTFAFPAYNYVAHSNQAAVNLVLSNDGNEWVGSHYNDFSQFGTYSGGMWLNYSNIYGLPYSSLKLVSATNPVQFITLSPGGTAPGTNPFYHKTTQPILHTVDYYFGTVTVDPTPGYLDGSFCPTNITPLIIAAVGQQNFSVAGYAKQSITNGSASAFAYLGQYFDKAVTTTNGVATTNSAGILSEYGDFFPIVPGHIILKTKPDSDQGNMQGQCPVEVIRLSVDVNHDGVMDETFTGPDNTTPERPFVFWVNNDYDRTNYDADDQTIYEDSVRTATSPYTPSLCTPDNNYRDGAGHRVIPTKRDLADFSRLWVSGVSNALSRLSSDSTVTLSWGDVGYPNPGNPVIDIFAAADSSGGMSYLTNETVASQQIDGTSCPYIGRLGPGDSIQLNASTFSNNWAGDHFIWCGAASGGGSLTLTIADGSGNILAQSVINIQIVDIKQMYERWTVGDIPGITPKTNAILAQDNFSPGFPATPFQYSYNSRNDTNTPYILFVHGWNMQPWEKDRFAESAFKRLYWQGYQGRFGLFRWPTASGFTGATLIATNTVEKDNYDDSEYTAWRSGAGLLNELTDLNSKYPGNVYLLAHSMGNVVAGEALRLSGSSRIVNTYVASQAAISAHTYDTNVANYSFNVTVGPISLNYGPYTPNIYGNWFASNYNGGAGSIVSFYNTNDFALARLHWELNQLFKPDQIVLEAGVLWNYGYSGSTNDSSPWTNFSKKIFRGTTVVNFNTTNLDDRYEVMPYAAQSYATALGATPVSTLAASVNLSAIWSGDPTGNAYKAHFWHSAEFRGDNPLQGPYWNELLGPAAFNLK